MAVKRVVFLAYQSLGDGPELVAIYSKSAYQQAYDWLAKLAERDGNAKHPLGLGYPTAGRGKLVAEVLSPRTGEWRKLERWEVS